MKTIFYYRVTDRNSYKQEIIGRCLQTRSAAKDKSKQPSADPRQSGVESSAPSRCSEEPIPSQPVDLDQVQSDAFELGRLNSVAVVATPLRYPHVREGDSKFRRASTTNLAADLERLDYGIARVSQKPFLHWLLRAQSSSPELCSLMHIYSLH